MDYEYVYVNRAFEQFTGLTMERVAGHTSREIVPGIETDEFPWIDEYGKIALQETRGEFDLYSQAMEKWLRIHAYSPKRGYCSGYACIRKMD